jgi:arsenate reductase
MAELRISLLLRKAFAELLGSALLAAAVVGSGIAASRLSPHDTGLQLLENSLATGAALVALILALGPVSAAFNPVVTLAERLFGALTTAEAALFVGAQVVGCSLGAMLANLMYDLPLVTLSSHHRQGGGVLLGEVVATFGLVVVIFGVVRSRKADLLPFAVGGYVVAAYWFTSSTSFANPAITLGRTLTDTFAGIAPSSVAAFVLMQVLGGALAAAALAVLYPDTSAVAADVAGRRPPVILFACVHNGGRSLAAKVLAAHYARGAVEVRSAGSEPGPSLNPVVVAVLEERGLDPSAERPTPLTRAVLEEADVVVTMGCGESCPVLPGKRYEDWPLADPKGQDLATVRGIVDDIDARVQDLLHRVQRANPVA